MCAGSKRVHGCDRLTESIKVLGSLAEIIASQRGCNEDRIITRIFSQRAVAVILEHLSLQWNRVRDRVWSATRNAEVELNIKSALAARRDPGEKFR